MQGPHDEAMEAKAPGEETAATEPAKEPSRQELASQAVARVPDITKGVAILRGLQFKEPVSAEYQSEEEFRAFIANEVKRDLPPAKNAALGKALVHVGLLPEKLDLAATMEDALVSQAGAYYDPKTEKFYLVMVPKSNMILDTISSHELTHALQDQHFDLNQYYYGHDGDGPPIYNEDQLSARRFIVEGEATFLMMAYTGYSLTKVNMLEDKRTVGALRGQLQKLASMNLDELKKMNKEQATSFVGMGDDITKAMESMDSIPLYILVPLMDSYVKGALPVYEAFAAGGWEAVNDLYKVPPDSTEQVLHPREKLFPKRDYPVSVSLVEPKGTKKVYSEVLGELGWRVYFQIWKNKAPNKAAAGWDGDRYIVWEKDGRLASATRTVWDNKTEAAEFRDAYLATLALRFVDGVLDDKNDIAVFSHKGGVIVVQLADTEVRIADGIDEKQARAHLQVATKGHPKRDPRDK